MLTDVQPPFLGTPLVPLKLITGLSTAIRRVQTPDITQTQICISTRRRTSMFALPNYQRQPSLTSLRRHRRIKPTLSRLPLRVEHFLMRGRKASNDRVGWECADECAGCPVGCEISAGFPGRGVYTYIYIYILNKQKHIYIYIYIHTPRLREESRRRTA